MPWSLQFAAQGFHLARCDMRTFRFLTTLLLGLVLSQFLPAMVPAQTFVDPLDTPATHSVLAHQRTLLAVARAGERLVAVGARGHIVFSDDRGVTWTQASVPVSADLTAVYFPSTQEGWAVGHGAVILHTADGGRSWTRQADGRSLARATVDDLKVKLAQSPEDRRLKALVAEAERNVEVGPDKPLLGVWFADEQTGFAVGAYNLIYRTGDGGKRWVPWFDRTENPYLLHLTAVHGHGRDVVVVGEKGLVLQLGASGDRFEARDTGYKGSFFSVLVTPMRTTVFGMRGNAYERAGDGAEWTRREMPVQGGLNGAALLEDGRVVVVSQDGKVLVRGVGATDGFAVVPQVRPSVFTGAAMAAGGQLVVVGLHGASSVAIP